MTRAFLPLLIGLALLAGARADVYPFKLKLATKHIDVSYDGSSVTRMHTEVELLPGAPAAQLARQTIPYIEAMQDVSISEAYTQKPDGRRLDVNLKDVVTERAATAGKLQKVIVFPDVQAGDTLVYTLTSRIKPVIAGGFMYADVISPSLGRDDTRLTITTPADYPLHADARGVVIVETHTAQKTTYATFYSVKAPVEDTGQYVAASDRERRFALSSYKNYDELAAAYGALVLPKIAVTPRIQALADGITAGIADRREQARALHGWIASHMTYVDEQFGTGWYIPNDAEAALVARKGDCKDHAVLFQALLKAKGIESSFVLIDAQNGYTISAVPDLVQFDHVIVWLPEFKTYVDPTAHTAPFGVLPFAQYGKPVIHIGDASGALHRTPVLATADSTLVNKTVARIDAQGALTVSSGVTASGPASIALRNLGDRMRARGPDDYLTGGLLVHRLQRTSGTFALPPAGDLSPRYELSATYTAAPAPRLLTGDAIPRPDNVTTVPPAEAPFAGPIAQEKFKNADPVACYSGMATDDLSFEFPAGSRLAALPKNASVKTANIDYTSRWTLAGQVVKVQREYRARFDTPLCSGETRLSAMEALARIREDYKQDVKLAPVSR